MTLILGVDIGGTGSRAALGEVPEAAGRPGSVGGEPRSDPGAIDGADSGPRVIDQFAGARIEIGPSGSTVLNVARELVRLAAQKWADRLSEVRGIGIGATGIASLAEDPSSVLGDLTAEFGVPVVAAIDAVTAHLGALNGTGGAITVLGTGAIAIAHPGADDEGMWSDDWSRADGWGHLFGDRGGGAWLGRNGLELALRTHDGIDEHGRALLKAATRRFGPPASWPGQFYTRNDRAGLLAEFAVDIAEAARSGDGASAELLRRAGQEAARSAVAAVRTAAPGSQSPPVGNGGSPSAAVAAASVRSAGPPVRIALTGGVAAAGSHLGEGFRTEAARLHPNVTIVDPAGGPLEGALTLGHLGAVGKLCAQERTVWT